jgi:predicted glycosyltransferase
VKVWIDLANSPHPLLFAPVARRLEALGHTIALTARDNAQTVELANERWDGVPVIGGASPEGGAAKAAAMLRRVRELVDWARMERPAVALSHNSYGQILAARRLGIRTVTAMDFEHQPLNHLAFRLADRVLLPEALRAVRMRRKGATPEKTWFYPGLKEEIYLGDFEPERQVLERVGIDPSPDTVLVVVRTPPSRAIYHRFDNPLFVEVLRAVAQQPEARLVVLPRHPEQRRSIAALGLPGLRVPERAVDSRSLIRAADLVIGAGGTMTREAALLGVPTVSVFAGETPAVDRWLERTGALRLLRSAADLPPVRRRAKALVDITELRSRGDRLVELFAGATVDSGLERSGGIVRVAGIRG